MALTKQTIQRHVRTIRSKKSGGNINSFAYGLNFYKLVWIFIIGCIIGFCVEMIWCYINNGYFESRKGLLYGPFSPVYGFGGVLLTVSLYRLRSTNSLLVFIVSAVIGAAFEYACSLFQEMAFGTVSWEYSDTPLNLGGRTNLQYAIFWGLLGMIFIKSTYPFLSNLIEKLPNRLGKWLTWVFLIFMVLNMLVSAVAVRRWTDRRMGHEADNSFTQFIDKLYPDDFMEKVYPNMTVVD